MRLRTRATIVAFAVLFLFTGVAAAETGDAELIEALIEFLEEFLSDDLLEGFLETE